ncbi:MAG: ERF family protein [Candidatus Acidiferrales bacterium]
MKVKTAELQTIPSDPRQGAAVTPMSMLQAAVDKGASVEQLKQLMDLQERYEANEARKAFVVALNAFKANPPDLVKNKQVSFETSRGTTQYKHATLDQVSSVIGAALSKVGISHRWEVEQLEGGRIRVTCVLTHERGHSERVPLEAKADDSGGKNSIQGVGSTVTYLQRYTLLSASGMAVRDSDDDGAGGAGLHEMDSRVKDDFQQRIVKLADKKAAQVLWQEIAAACTKAGDVQTYDELKAEVSAKVKALNKAETEQRSDQI